MKFNLANALLFFALLAVSLGWFVDRMSLPDSEQIQMRISDSIQQGIVIGCTIKSNDLYQRSVDLNEFEFAQHRTKELVENTLDMAFCAIDAKAHRRSRTGRNSYTTVPDGDTFSYLASQSLQLLGVNSVLEFEQLLASSEISNQYHIEDTIVDGKLRSDIYQFVKSSLNKTKVPGADSKSDTVKTEAKSPE